MEALGLRRCTRSSLTTTSLLGCLYQSTAAALSLLALEQVFGRAD
jgi:hypothetical protein